MTIQDDMKSAVARMETIPRVTPHYLYLNPVEAERFGVTAGQFVPEIDAVVIIQEGYPAWRLSTRT